MQTRKDTLLKVLYAFIIALGIICMIAIVDYHSRGIAGANNGHYESIYVLIFIDILLLALLTTSVAQVRKYWLNKSLARLSLISLGICIVTFMYSLFMRLINMTSAKPVIYLYPETTEEVSVQLIYPWKLTTLYPEFNKADGWNVTAHPDGRVFIWEKEYSYLFREGVESSQTYDLTQGFVVKDTDAAEFLREKLAHLGLTPKEYNEMIVYWLPYLEQNPYNLVHFATKAEYDEKVPLTISPTPDSVLRVFIVIAPVNSSYQAAPQVLTPTVRDGFTVVERGGTYLPSIHHNSSIKKMR